MLEHRGQYHAVITDPAIFDNRVGADGAALADDGLTAEVGVRVDSGVEPNGDGGLNSPFDAYLRMDDVLVGGITSDAIHRYDLAGAYIADLAAIDNFPEQLA